MEQSRIRLQKYMAQCGVASRRKCESLIAQGLVRVNGQIITDMGVQVQPGDHVEVDGKPITPQQEHIYLAFYKPSCVMTTMDDPRGRKTVMAYLSALDARVFPVGRLDYLSEGLLLMTNDGDWANRILHPAFEKEKEYLVRVRGALPEDAVRKLREGVVIDGRRTSPARVTDVRPSADITSLHITIHEGRNRQVRKMLEAVGYDAVYLKRLRIGAVDVSGLASGQWRRLTRQEIDALAAPGKGEL